jgi:hypothetical protein
LKPGALGHKLWVTTGCINLYSPTAPPPPLAPTASVNMHGVMLRDGRRAGFHSLPGVRLVYMDGTYGLSSTDAVYHTSY